MIELRTSSNGRKWRVAVVGCGYWGVNYLRVLDELPSVQTVVACDASESRLADIASRNPRIILETDLDRLVGSGDVDAVVLATPATTHANLGINIVRSGKHLLVEKPIAMNSDDAQALIDASEEAGVTLAVGHTFLHHPAIRTFKRLIDEGRLGLTYYLYSRRTNLGPIRSDVSAVWDLAPHDISIFNHILGAQPLWVSAVGSRMLRNSREDVAFVNLWYPDNVVAHVHVSWADPSKVRQLVAVGSDSRIVFDDLVPAEHVRVYEKGVTNVSESPETFGEHQLEIRDGDIISPRIPASEPLKNQVLDFLDSAANHREPLSGGLDGVRVVRVMEAIERSIAARGAPVLIDEAAGDEILIDLREDSIAVEGSFGVSRSS